MRRRRLILAALLAFLLLGSATWFLTMPYPIADWWAARSDVRNWDTWPVSQSDEAFVKHLMQRDLRFREIITGVTVTAPDRIQVSTLFSASGPCGPGRRCRYFGKVNGLWEFVPWIT